MLTQVKRETETNSQKWVYFGIRWGIPIQDKQAICESVQGLGQVVFIGWECEEGRVQSELVKPQSPT